ncbi:MAG: hypothetical protein ACP5I4_07430 [Oceanipulchritudo sp.]
MKGKGERRGGPGRRRMGAMALGLLGVELSGGPGWVAGLEEAVGANPGEVTVESRVRYEVFDLAGGLEDLHVRVEYLVPVGQGVRLTVIHHWFRPRRGAGDYGNEIDLVASCAINKRWSLLGKYGRYSSDGGSGGVGGPDKTMLTLEIDFIY